MSDEHEDLKRRLPGNEAGADGPGQGPEQEPEGGGGARAGGLLAIAAVALLLAVVTFVMMRSMSTPEPEPAPTPAAAAAAAVEELPDVTLTLYVEREGRAEPLPPGQDIAVGDSVLFELSSEAPAPVRLWIEESGVQLEDLGTIDADPTPAMIGAEDGMLAWNFGSSRTVTVRASAAKRGCPAASCASQVVVAR